MAEANKTTIGGYLATRLEQVGDQAIGEPFQTSQVGLSMTGLMYRYKVDMGSFRLGDKFLRRAVNRTSALKKGLIGNKAPAPMSNYPDTLGSLEMLFNKRLIAFRKIQTSYPNLFPIKLHGHRC